MMNTGCVSREDLELSKSLQLNTELPTACVLRVVVIIIYSVLKPESLSFTLVKQYGTVWKKALLADCCLSRSKLYFFCLRKTSHLIKQQKLL